MVTLFHVIGGTITLPNPTWGDTEWFESAAIIRRNKGQEILVASDATWNDITRISVTFRFVSATVIGTLLTFLHTSAGYEIVYTDHRADAHNVIILTPANKIAQEGLEICAAGGRRNVSLEMEVV